MDNRFLEYLSYLESVRGLSSRTVRVYRDDLERFETYLDGMDLDSVKAHEIRAFAGSLVMEGKASSSVNRALSTIRGYFRHRMRFSGAASNPGREVENLASARPLPKFLFDEEMGTLIDSIGEAGFADARDKALFEVLYSTGCRASEISGMSLDRMDAARGLIRVIGKGSKERVVFLGRKAMAALGAYMAMRSMRLSRLKITDHGKIFVNAKGNPLGVRGMERIVDKRRIGAQMKKNISPHAFRHSFATQLVASGADIRVVQEMLGHTSVSTTQVYAHVDMERLRKVYELAHPHGTKGE